MLRILDSAGVPSARTLKLATEGGVDGYAGYLSSPYASVSWSPVQLGRVLAAAGRLLPVYVAPYDGRTLAGMNPTADARRALDGLHSITGARSLDVLGLDIEYGAWAADPAAVIRYHSAFTHEVNNAGVRVAVYANPATLLGIGQHDRIAGAWVASWLHRSGKGAPWPTSVEPPGVDGAFTGRRAWQFAGNVRRFGRLVDTSVADDTFPTLVHVSNPTPPPPTPSPAPAPARVTVHAAGQTYSGTVPAA